MRGFYRIEKRVFRDRGDDTVTPESLGAVVLHIGRNYVLLHVADHSRMRGLGEHVAGSWRELKNALTDAQRRRVFRKRVRRSVSDEDGTRLEEIIVPMEDTETADVVLSDWLPPHKFLGDPDPEPVP